MICRWPSTAACALYACSKLFVAGSFMIRESGSVKLHLALQLPLALLHTRIAHRLVLGGVGLDPRAVQRDVTERHQASPLTEQQPLHEKAGERREMPLAKLRDRVVIGMLVGGQYSKGDVLVGRPLDLSRRRLADAIRVEQELHHHGWVVGGLPAAVAALVGVQDG